MNDTVSRLQQYVTGINLTTSDLYAMQQMCAYETVALGYSQFCGLFTEQEWRGFDYSIGNSCQLFIRASVTLTETLLRPFLLVRQRPWEPRLGSPRYRLRPGARVPFDENSGDCI